MSENNTGTGKAKVRTSKRDSQTWLDLVTDAFTDDKNWRESTGVERQWMINTAYYRGDQDVKYDSRADRVTFSKKDPLRFNINMIYPTVRVIRAAVTRNSPTWNIDAIPFGVLDDEKSRILNEWMVAMFEKLGMKYTVKELIYHGLICGKGWLQYGFDNEAENGEGEVWVTALDPFDVYLGSRASTGLADAERVTKVIRRSMKQLKQMEKDGIYKNVNDIKDDNMVSLSPWKTMLNEDDEGGDKGDGTALIRETWWKEEDKIIVVTWADGVILRIEETELESFPFVSYNPDITPEEVYNEGWVKPLVPLNRAINYIEQKILKHNIIMATGKYVTDPDSGVKMVSNSVGDVVKVRKGARFEQLRLSPMSSTPFNQLNSLHRQFQDISGVQDALMGRAPTGVTAAVAFEELVSNSLANMSDLIDNLSITLESLGNAIIELGYENYSVTKPFRVRSSDGTSKILKIGGRDARIADGDKEAVKLPEAPFVRVKVAAGSANTKQGKQDLSMDLRRQGDLDRRTLLEEVGYDPNEVEARLAEEATGGPISDDGLTEEELAQQGQPTPEQGAPAEQPAPAQPAPQEITVEEFLALLEQEGVLGELPPEAYQDIVALQQIADELLGVGTLIIV